MVSRRPRFRRQRHQQEVFRQKCVVEYVRNIADYCKARHPQLETMSCLMPTDREMWVASSEIASLDNMGTDIYWVNEERDIEEMTPLVRELDAICKKSGKKHHEWLQCYGALKGRERRILEQGQVLVREQPDALYVWAWKGQIGTAESCHDPEASWRYACEVLKTAKNAG